MSSNNSVEDYKDRRSRRTIALIGYSLPAIEAASELSYNFICVVPEDYVSLLEADGVKVLPWNFDKISQDSEKLYKDLAALNVDFAIGLFEETVEWAGMINAFLLNDSRLFNHSLLFRDKAMMKRKAQMSGIRVGVFEEVDTKDAAKKFFNKINQALSHLEEDVKDPVHLKPLNSAGSIGHYVIHSIKDIEDLEDRNFPCLAESHLDGQEFSVEAFIHKGKIFFLNINEYVRLGYSQILPPSPKLEAYRPIIRKAVEKLVRAFNVQDGIIHPEYFIDQDGDLNFGEVAKRVPGGHIFELIEQAYGFNAYQGMLLCSDPDTSEAELESFFPDEINGKKGHAANLLIYPHKRYVTNLNFPDSLDKNKYFVKHDMFEPVTPKVAERIGFGNHYGKILFFGDEPEEIIDLLNEYENYDFYT